MNIKKLTNKLQKYIIHIGLVIVLVLLFLYLFSEKFKYFLLKQSIDPNFIIGFFAVIALFLSLIQSSKDKRYTYNLRLVESIEDKGLKIISKLIIIKQKSLNILNNLKLCKKALDENKIFKDLNKTLIKEDVERDMELVTAYIDTYFPEQSLRWNEILDKLSIIATYNANIVLNFNKNIDLIIKRIPFANASLDKIDQYIKEVEKVNEEIDNLTHITRDEIVTKINNVKGKLKNSFNFKL